MSADAQHRHTDVESGAGTREAPKGLGRLLSVVFMVVAFAAVALIFRRWLPQVDTGATEDVQAQQAEETWQEEAPVYEGVDDPWTGGAFTMGSSELDSQIKAFCDAHTTEGNSARQNAYDTYIAIVWSNFEARAAGETPTGPDWEVVAAKHFFSTGNPEAGEGGRGDYYEYAAAITYCLRYFGFADAVTIPITSAAYANYNAGSALTYVTDETGQLCVCDPAVAADGWMRSSSIYNITVDDFGQDLSRAEALGLPISEPTANIVDISIGDTTT